MYLLTCFCPQVNVSFCISQCSLLKWSELAPCACSTERQGLLNPDLISALPPFTPFYLFFLCHRGTKSVHEAKLAGPTTEAVAMLQFLINTNHISWIHVLSAFLWACHSTGSLIGDSVLIPTVALPQQSRLTVAPGKAQGR